MQKVETVFTRNDMIEFAKLVEYMFYPVEVYVLDDSWTPSPTEFPVNTIAVIEPYARALAQLGVISDEYWRPANVTLCSKRDYVCSDMTHEVDEACVQRWRKDGRTLSWGTTGSGDRVAPRPRRSPTSNQAEGVAMGEAHVCQQGGGQEGEVRRAREESIRRRSRQIVFL